MKRILLCLVTIALLFSCKNENKPIKYPYRNMGCITEDYGRDFNEKCIYMIDNIYNKDTLEMFCRNLKQAHTDERLFYRYVFYSADSTGKYPPFTAFYKIDVDNMPELLPYIKAEYTHNTGNGYSKLQIYDDNKWSGKLTEIEI